MSVTVPVGFTVDYEKSFHMDKVELFEIVGVILLKVPEFTLSIVPASEFSSWSTTDESLALCPIREDFVLSYVGIDSSGGIYLAPDGKYTSTEDIVRGACNSCIIADYLSELSLSMLDDFFIPFDNYFSINVSPSILSVSYRYGSDTVNNNPVNFFCNSVGVAISDFVGLADYAEDSLYYIGDLDLLEKEDATELVCRKDCKVVVLDRVKYLKSLVIGKSVENIVFYGRSTLVNLRKLYVSKNVSKEVMVQILHNLIISFYHVYAEPYDVMYLKYLVKHGNYERYWSFLIDNSGWRDIDMDFILSKLEVVVY